MKFENLLLTVQNITKEKGQQKINLENQLKTRKKSGWRR